MLKVLLIGHFLGDFYLQFDTIQKNKYKWIWLVLHSFIYAFVVTLSFSIYKHNWWIIVLFAIFFASHLIVDKCKGLLEKCLQKTNLNNKFDVIIYIIDQLIHIAIIIGVAWFFSENTLNKFGEWFYCITRYLKVVNLSGVVLTATIIFVPTSTFISKVFDGLQKSKVSDEQILSIVPTSSPMENESSKAENQQNVDFKAGKIIGYLERFLILILFIMELYTVIGLVLTAKSLARFKQFEDKYFAEKFLIGTLLSLAITIFTFMLSRV